MLQWTREGQETLEVARRQHNGGIECFRKRDYAASKRFLQNALAIRKTVLTHTHPIILGTVEMLSIVSELAQNATRPGCSVRTSLFQTAEEPPAVNHEADERALKSGIATIPQLARLRMRNDPAINERFEPASPSFTLFKNADGVTIDPCLVELHMNKEELRMILWELFYLQQLRLGPYHVDTQLTLTRLWEVSTELKDYEMTEALSRRIWEIRCSPPSERRAIAMDVALGHPNGIGLSEGDANGDYVVPPSVHPSSLLFSPGQRAAVSSPTRSGEGGARGGPPRLHPMFAPPPYSDFDFTLSNLERRAPNSAGHRARTVRDLMAAGIGGSPSSSPSDGSGMSGVYSSGNTRGGLANFYTVQPKIQRKIPLLEDDSWEKQLREQLGVDKDVDELLHESAMALTSSSSAHTKSNQL